jgi:hypothetical protein
MSAANLVQVRRVLTRTPLARLHERGFLRKGSRRRSVPFEKFHPASYPESVLTLAAEAHLALARGEYTAVDLFAQIASGLTLNAAPFDIVAAATRVPSDEIHHADLALRMAQLLANRDVMVEFDPAAAARQSKQALDQEGLDLAIVQTAAIGETLACALLDQCRRRASDPTIRALLSCLVGDEVHHARLGWYYLAWRAPQWSRAERQRVADHAGALVMDVECRFWRGRDAPEGAQDAARALGVLESDGQRRAVRAVMEDEIVPALDALGLGASHAWRARRRGS